MVRKVALMTNMPAPYRLPFFRSLAKQTDLKVIFDQMREGNRQWEVPGDLGFPHAYVAGLTIPYKKKDISGTSLPAYLHLRYGAIIELVKFSPDIVISLEMGFRSLQALLYCKLRSIPLILWTENTHHTKGRGGKRRDALRRMLISSATRCWTNGIEGAEFLEAHGASRAAIDQGMIGVDAAWFAEEVRHSSRLRNLFRETHKLRGTVFLFVGQLIPRKGVAEMLNALEILAPHSNTFSLVIVGEGEERVRVQRWSEENPGVHVRMLGYRQQIELPEIYAGCDVFVLPTWSDNWSLVSLESAVAGLPQLFSSFNGVTPDLLAKGATGRVFDPRDPGALAEGMLAYIRNTPPRASSVAVGELVRYYSSAELAQRGMASIERALETTRTRFRAGAAR